MELWDLGPGGNRPARPGVHGDRFGRAERAGGSHPHWHQGQAHRRSGGRMTKIATALDRIADAALAELSEVRPTDDAVGAAIAAAALLAERAAQEVSDRDR